MSRDSDEVVQSKLDELGVFTRLDDVAVIEGTVALVDNVIRVDGSCEVTFRASSDSDTESSWQYLPATFTARLDEDGVYIENVSLNTFAWLDEEDDTWLAERIEEDACLTDTMQTQIIQSLTLAEVSDDPFSDEGF